MPTHTHTSGDVTTITISADHGAAVRDAALAQIAGLAETIAKERHADRLDAATIMEGAVSLMCQLDRGATAVTAPLEVLYLIAEPPLADAAEAVSDAAYGWYDGEALEAALDSVAMWREFMEQLDVEAVQAEQDRSHAKWLLGFDSVRAELKRSGGELTIGDATKLAAAERRAPGYSEPMPDLAPVSGILRDAAGAVEAHDEALAARLLGMADEFAAPGSAAVTA